MKKTILLALALFLAAAPVLGEVKFTDVPADHWAAKSVYDLVRMGITQGYPDGTFRGMRNMTRYETAMFLSKLSDRLGGTEIAQLRLELGDLKNEVSRLKGTAGSPISGEYEMVSRIANVLTAGGGVTGRGPLIAYRLKASLKHEFGQGAELAVNFDSMDAGFNGASREAITELIDIEGRVKINPVDVGLADFGFTAPIELLFTMGPGALQHADVSGIVPSEDGYTYERPDSGIKLSSKLFGVGIKGGYAQAEKSDSGVSETSRLFAGLSYEFSGVPLIDDLNASLAGDYFFKHPASSAIRDFRTALDLSTSLSERTEVRGTIGASGTERSGMLVKGEIEADDQWGTGTKLLFRGAKVGADYITADFAAEQFDIAGLDLFMRPLRVSTVNVALKLEQNISEKLILQGIGDIRMGSDMVYGSNRPGSKATGQIGFNYLAAPSTRLDLYYRFEQDPVADLTSDIAAFGIRYDF